MRFLRNIISKLFEGTCLVPPNIFNYHNLWSVGTKISVLEKSEILFGLTQFVGIIDSNYDVITE